MTASKIDGGNRRFPFREEPAQIVDHGLLDQVGGVEADAQRLADQRAGHLPQVVAVELQEPAQRGFITGAGLLQEPLGDCFGR